MGVATPNMLLSRTPSAVPGGIARGWVAWWELQQGGFSLARLKVCVGIPCFRLAYVVICQPLPCLPSNADSKRSAGRR